MAKPTYNELKRQHDELLATMRHLEAALHDGPTAESDGHIVRMVREHEGDYLTALTDLGNDAAQAIRNATKA